MRGKGLTVTNVAISHRPPGHRGASFPHVLNQLVVVCEWERDIILQREEKSQQLLKAQICGKLSYSCHFSLVSVNKWRESSELNWVEIYPSTPIPPLGWTDGWRKTEYISKILVRSVQPGGEWEQRSKVRATPAPISDNHCQHVAFVWATL